MSLIEFDGVNKAYEAGKRVVCDLQLQVTEGEFLTLLGPSGSGKTTTLMMLAGFEAPDTGAIRVRGQAVHTLPPHRRNIGMVFQHYALFPHMSVAQNIAFPLDVRKIPATQKREKVAAALARVRLQGFDDRKPAQLSGGQQQRVALARALVFEPPIVLMDEPLGALDKNLREELQLEIKRIHRETGTTILYVTHDQAEAMTMSDRIALFNEGCIQQCAAPDVLYNAPANRFVAQFLGDNNFFALPDGRTLAVRPEALSLTPPQGLHRTWHGTLTDIIALGDHMRLLIQTPENSQIMVKTAPQVFASSARLTRGQAISVFALETAARTLP
jgi:putative spermidine/putrescine transport system ATP-binding protein